MQETSQHFAVARARQALKAAGLPFSVPLERANSTRNEVFISPDSVIRINRNPNQRLRRELHLYASLPREPWAPVPIHAGGEFGSDYLIVQRKPGQPLSRAWPTMGPNERRHAIRCLAKVLSQLHATRTPTDLPDLDVETHLLDPKAMSVVLPALQTIEKLLDHPGIDAGVIRAAQELTLQGADSLADFHQRTLIHGDLTFENILWDGRNITALLDLEWCRGSSPDLDLDVLLRFCAIPYAHVAADYEHLTRAEDYEAVPSWLAQEMPELFGHPELHRRLLAYCAAFDIRDLVENMPRPGVELGPLHPMKRLRSLVSTGAHVTSFVERLGIPA